MAATQDLVVNTLSYKKYVLNDPVVTTGVQKSDCGKKIYDVIRLFVNGIKNRAL
jgi:hypothetical protein